ncbi:methylated-DNA--[protein]-cysteine S-methyltransferase [Anoxynatronum buryatiense]|uniref:Methylated-DNA--protein-cysteine methyltransferase n=1 Tax=Anoxynatronum buryatiense TaxID=489973 RepID=A0AA46AJE5_9CLOT|nr:methylated-DNA--[protein]-cysteine S-methyltransferase [Anoxynatronum buryatiense]SMP60543.1 methylated-DNA-[protein]-cysteine S-methyltransferase [Anoxynatronum buryatiense]
MSLYYYETEAGNFGIAEKNGSITHLFFEEDPLPQNMEIHETALLREAAKQLRQYLAKERTRFTLPMKPVGTEFFQKAWAHLCTIPYGETLTYKALAIRLGSPRAARAVGLANRHNPIPILIPCHRVIGSNGSLTGYRGGLALKQRLLELERIAADHKKIAADHKKIAEK